MFEINGKYATALITTDNIEDEAIAQVTELVNSAASKDSKIVIMPDVHAGKGCVIGTTMTISDRVVPNLVGVDIGCGVLAYEISEKDIDFQALQNVIDNCVPAGFNVHEQEVDGVEDMLKDLVTPLNNRSHVFASLGTLGGGNHFISVESDGEKSYLIIHTGSRNLGTQIAKYHQNIAATSTLEDELKTLIAELKAKGLAHTIQAEIKAFKDANEDIIKNKDLAFLQGEQMENYLNDVKIAQKFAAENRKRIADTIFEEMEWKKGLTIESVHNYIDTNSMVLRKGAISSNGYFLVPLNMKDGTLICYGEGNAAWNNSAPHGAGRAMSRSKAKQVLNVEDFKEEMKNVWSATVNQSTLDEAPGAYKPAEEIKKLVGEQYLVIRHLKTVFNFKASE